MKPGRLLSRTLVVFFVVLAPALSIVANAGASTASTIDFEGLAAGTVVSSVSFGSGISGADAGGSVGVSGLNPKLAGNQAMIFDATCGGLPPCSGGDDDLFKPALGNVLIISEDGDSTDPDDADVVGAFFNFDFSAWGPGVVTVNSLDVLDVEAVEPGAQIELFSGVTLLATVPIPSTGDNGLANVAVGVSGVDFMRVTLNGSGAIDNISIETEEPPGGEGCTPGFWKNHLDAWAGTGFIPGDDFEVVFGVNASFDPHTLLDAINLGGGGEKALARHAVAALLNAASPDVDYAFTVADVISMVQNAYASGDFTTAKDLFDAANNAGCPLD